MNPLIRDANDILKLYDPVTKQWDELTLNGGQEQLIGTKLFIFKNDALVSKINRPLSGYVTSILNQITCLKFGKGVMTGSKCKDNEQIYLTQPSSSSLNPGYDLESAIDPWTG